MRFSAGVVSFGLFIDRASAVATCTTLAADWFPNMMYCVYDTTDLTLSACTGSTWTGVPSLDSAFKTAAETSSTPCNTCLGTFYTGAKLKLDALKATTACGATYTQAGAMSYGCLLALYDEINALNECNADPLKDFVTAGTPSRCSYEQFFALERDFLPYGSMVTLAKAGVLLASYPARIRSTFSTRLAAVACGTCYGTLYSAILGTGSLSTVCANPYSTACVTALATPLEAFAACTGGFILHTDFPSQCDVTELGLVDSVFRPFQGLVACSDYHPISQASHFRSCMSDYNGLIEAPATNCDSCFDALVIAIEEQKSVACSSYSSSSCISSLEGLYGALPEFEICAGYAITTAATRCSSYQWSHLDASSKSYVDILIEALRMNDEFFATELIDNSIYLTALSADRADLPCSSCFDAFAADVFNAYSSSGIVRTACSNPYSENCFLNDDIIVANDRFKACAGYALLYGYDSKCSSEETGNMTDSAIPLALLNLALNSTTAAQVSLGYAPIIALLGVNRMTVSCSFCYWNLVNAVFGLSTAVKEICNADWEDAVCQRATTDITDAFEACSGFVFDSVLPTTAAPTTEAPTTNTEAPTTEATTAPTTAEPTTKGGVVVTAALSLLAMAAAL